MKKLMELLGENEKVFVELANENLKQKFLQQAKDEGFVINGRMPTTQKAESVMIVHKDYTITYLCGFIAHMEYYHSTQTNRYLYSDLLT